MPSSILTPEYPSVVGVLDEDALTQGHFADAHVLGSIARSANRLAGKGNYLVHEPYRVAGAALEVSGMMGIWAVGQWKKLAEYPAVRRKPHLRTAEVRIRAQIASGSTVIFQLATGAVAPRFAAVNGQLNTASCAGTGSWAWYTWTVQLAALEQETLSLWVFGDPANVSFPGAFGTPASGSCENRVTYNMMLIGGASWTEAINTASVTCEWLGVSGNPVAARRSVRRSFSRADELYWVEPMSDDELRAANATGSTFRLSIGTQVRIGAVIVRERDAYAT